jgi:predicted RNA methylase
MTGQLSFAGVGPETDPALSQWFTPPRLAEKVVDFALDGLGRNRLGAGAYVLEPSAGAGALALPALSAGANVTAVEIDARWGPVLEQRGSALVRGSGGSVGWLHVETLDYLRRPAPPVGRFDVGILNPPYEGNLDAAFVAKALNECRRVVALLRSHAGHGVERWNTLWSRIAPEGWVCSERKLVRRPDFGGDFGAKHEYVVIRLDILGSEPAVPIRWWPESWS